MEFYALLFGIVNLHAVGRHLLLCPAIDQVDIRLADPERGTDAVDCHISTAHDNHFLAFGIGVSSEVDL